MAEILRLGFAGLGEAATLVIPEVAKLPYIQLTAAADLSPSARDRFQQQYGSYPAQVVADGGFTNHESVIAMHERNIEFFGASGSVACSDPKQKEEASIAPNSSPMMTRQIR